MRSFRFILIFGYLALSGWWFASNSGVFINVKKTYFCLGLAIYFVIIPALFTLVSLMKIRVFNLRLFLIFITSGVLFFGLSFLSTFCDVLINGESIYYKSPMIFYIFQFPLCILGLLMVRDIKRRGIIFILITLFVFYVSFISSKNFASTFYKFYFPIKSAVLIVVSTFILRNLKGKDGSSLILLGFLLWFFGDLIRVVSGNHPHLSHLTYSEFLYLSAIFLLLRGVFGYIGRQGGNILRGQGGTVSLREISYQIPFSLNSNLN